MPGSRFDHIDLVVTSLEHSLDFYRELLGPLGWSEVEEIRGERGETIHYLSSPDRGSAALGLRERQSGSDGAPPDRYSVGLHHLCLIAPSREAVDDCARRLVDAGATIESPPQEYDYSPGYYALFFFDPDGIKLELRADPLDR